MKTQNITQTVLFHHLAAKPITVAMDQAHSSSDGGAILLQALDRRADLTASLASVIRDRRQQGKISHTVEEILRQRVFGIALGYPDANDANTLRHDPIHKLLAGRDPVRGDSIGSQSTLSRFENSVGRADLYRMGDALADQVLAYHRRRLRGRCRRIFLDFDPTDDPTHGQQEFSFFHGHYDTYCYLPLVGTIAFDGERDQALLCALLRPGRAAAHVGLIPILRRLLPKIRRAFPRARICVRLDGGFGAPSVLDYLDSAKVDYVVGLGATQPLKKKARRDMAAAKRRWRATGRTVSVFGDTRYKTKTSWPHARRVMWKAGIVEYPGREPKENLRFVVTNLKCSPRRVYEIYRDRGDAENRIKELKNDLAMDRTSCSRFLANQLRVLLTAAAYVLMQMLRWCASDTDCRAAQAGTLRGRLLKLAAWVQASARRFVVHLPRDFPGRHTWNKIAVRLGAQPA